MRLENRVRLEESSLELSGLRDDLHAWLTRRRGVDRWCQYKSQLNAIDSLLTGAIGVLAHELDGAEGDAPTGTVYDWCRRFDLRVLWLRRLWKFFGDKFDQRDSQCLGPALAAADEVVWSCHQLLRVQAEICALTLPARSAPLPFVESQYVPEAFPSELVPYSLKTDVDVGFARDHLNRLPVPVVRITQSCVSAPWWLVYIAHEMGHHVQYGLLPEMGMVGLFRSKLEGAVGDHKVGDNKIGNNEGNKDGDGARNAERWGRWAEEIFADVYSVLTLGQWAVWAMVEMELQASQVMITPTDRYPAPWVRLSLLAHTADCLGLPGTAALRGVKPDPGQVDEQTAADLQMVPQVVAAALAPLPQLAVSLAKLAGFRVTEFRSGGEVDQARALFSAGRSPAPIESLRGARIMVAAALASWSDVSALADTAKRRERRESLASHAITAIQASREEGTRAAPEAPGEMSQQAAGEELGRLLLLAPLDTLIATAIIPTAIPTTEAAFEAAG